MEHSANSFARMDSDSSSQYNGPEFDFIPENTQKITNEYLITSEILGKGAFGVVRKCIHLITNQARAIKIVFKRHCIEVKQNKKKIIREINILKHLNHPNIVRVYEYFQDEEYIFIVMELVKGVELLGKIMEVRHMSERTCSVIMEQVLATVYYLHSNHIVHRDIKPENILYDGERIKIIDFGTAMMFKPNKRMKSLNGTPYYIAPEVLNGSYDERCDIWSCGVIMYILITGSPPFRGKSDKEIFSNIQKGFVNYDSPEFSLISENAKALLRKLLTHNFKDRISASEAINDVWFNTIRLKKNLEPDKAILNNLKDFYVSNQFQRAIYLYLISNLASNDEKNKLMKTFQALDLNQDGVLSKDEIQIGLKKGGIFVDENEIQEIMNLIGEKNNDHINYMEFIAAALDKKKLFDEKKIMHCFKMFDRDKKGKISISNFRSILQTKTELTDESWRDMIKEYDINGDGEIEFFEFREILMKIIKPIKSEFN